MSGQIKFIHTADLHLGAPLNCGGSPSEELSNIFNQAGYQSLAYIVDTALEEEVSFLLISGDLYDREARSVKASRFFVEQCKRLEEAKIPVYVISGNHDPLGDEKQPFSPPDNVHTFSSQEVEIKEFRSEEGRLKARILGQSYRQKFEERKMYRSFTAPDTNVPNIGLLHTQLDRQNNRYVPVAQQYLLKKKEITYWALGHIHQPRIIQKKDPAIIYPGAPQGRQINDLGVRGFYLVTVEDQMKLEFKAASPVIYKKIDINLEKITKDKEIENISDLQQVMKQRAKELLSAENDDFDKSFKQNIFQGFVVRWVISGRGSIHQYITEHREEATQELLRWLNKEFSVRRPFIWSHSVVFRTGAKLPDISELKEQNEIIKEIEQLVDEILTEDELQQQLLDSWGQVWTEDNDPEEQEVDKFAADQKTKKELIQEAKDKIFTRLLQRGEFN